MNRNLLILGAGMHGAVVKEIAEEMGNFEKISFLDDTYATELEKDAFHEEAIGKLNDYGAFRAEYDWATVAIGNAELREELTAKLRSANYRIATVISPRAYVSPSAQIREGAVIEPLAGINANAVIGFSTFVSMGAVVNHNACVEDFCHVDCNAVIMSGAYVPKGSLVQTGSVTRKVPMKFTLTKNGILAEPIPQMPTGDGWNFDDVM